jgi:hypothetical protein
MKRAVRSSRELSGSETEIDRSTKRAKSLDAAQNNRITENNPKTDQTVKNEKFNFLFNINLIVIFYFYQDRTNIKSRQARKRTF